MCRLSPSSVRRASRTCRAISPSWPLSSRLARWAATHHRSRRRLRTKQGRLGEKDQEAEHKNRFPHAKRVRAAAQGMKTRRSHLTHALSINQPRRTSTDADDSVDQRRRPYRSDNSHRADRVISHRPRPCVDTHTGVSCRSPLSGALARHTTPNTVPKFKQHTSPHIKQQQLPAGVASEAVV